MSNTKTVSYTLILSEFDYETLWKSANEVGLKKSEYLRLIIQGIGAGSKKIIRPDLVNAYGLAIDDDISEKILQSISEKLINALKYDYCEKNLINPRRKKRMKNNN